MNRKELTEKAIELATIGNIMTRTCCVCRCIYDGKLFDKRDIDNPPGHDPKLNHGICPVCFDKQMIELKKVKISYSIMDESSYWEVKNKPVDKVDTK